MKKYKKILCLLLLTAAFLIHSEESQSKNNLGAPVVQRTFGGATFSLQNKDENAYNEKLLNGLNLANETVFLAFPGWVLLMQDYEQYKKDKNSNTNIYAMILNQINNVNKGDKSNKDENLKVLYAIKKKYDEAVLYKSTGEAIKINDSVYSKLDIAVKELLIQINRLSNDYLFDKEYEYYSSLDRGRYYVSEEHTKLLVKKYCAILEKGLSLTNEFYDRKLEEFQNNKSNMEVLYKIKKEIDSFLTNFDILYSLMNNKNVFSRYAWMIKNGFVENENSAINNLKSLSQDIQKHGLAYEKRQYTEKMKKNNKKMFCNVGLSSYVYYPNAPRPENICWFKHVPRMDFPLRVVQTAGNGVILSGLYGYGLGGNFNNIFLQTSQSYADGQLISEDMIAEYVGFYEYYTVLGAKRKIYKFRRLNQKEIDVNFEVLKQPFYFFRGY